MDWQRLAPASTRKQMVATALAGLLLGLGGVTAGTSLVQASERGGLFDFFETIFRGPAPEPVAMPARRRPAHYASLPDDRTATRAVRQTPRPRSSVALVRAGRRAKTGRGDPRLDQTPSGAAARLVGVALGARTVCVRSCDGYLFPLGRLAGRADLPVHEAACAAACPNTPTRLFTLGAGEAELDRAIGLDGRPYRSLAVANLYRTRRVAQCSCQPEGHVAVPLPIAQDLTLRAGDVVTTTTGAGVVTPSRPGGFTVVDFREARGISRRARREIDAKVDVIRREADARAFRKAMRSADRAGRIRVAAGPGFQPVPPPIEVEGAFAPVRAPAGPRVVMASPFVY
ncbi:DUF2865 domain-containing protein [Methylobacterium sp. J-068]|uniref:DUF2865 domain-containing protein n=1 Tax=Methylobacterium sp. J-068 TaxID=2836649 RepID=UPI001FBB03B1|nr:DUF2865 domain-containing protein [Methylobacterium sp. J-068]MCJ2033591.1 DUF2865 domain-containing protein [Methylobacterium sp. J-068]